MRRSSCAALLLSAAGAACAQPVGPYLGTGYGEFAARPAGDPAKASAPAGDGLRKAYAGVRLLPYFALQLDYADLGAVQARAPTQAAEVEARAAGLSAVVFMPLGGRLDLFARAGGAYWEVSGALGAAQDALGAPYSRAGRAPTYGAGLDIGLTARMSVRAEWERIEGDVLGVDLWNAGVMYVF